MIDTIGKYAKGAVLEDGDNSFKCESVRIRTLFSFGNLVVFFLGQVIQVLVQM